MAGESVMSQEEIDALIGNTPEPAPPPPPVAPPAAPPAPTGLPAVAPLAPAPNLAQSSVQTPVDLSDIYDRLENLEKAVRRVGELDRVQYDIEQSIRQVQHDVKNVAGQLQQVAAQMKVMMSNLQATPGYGAMKTHKCASCGSTGAVAVPIKCTKCGTSSYKGRATNGSARRAVKRPAGAARPSGARPKTARGAARPGTARPPGRRPAGARPK